MAAVMNTTIPTTGLAIVRRNCAAQLSMLSNQTFTQSRNITTAEVRFSPYLTLRCVLVVSALNSEESTGPNAYPPPNQQVSSAVVNY